MAGACRARDTRDVPRKMVLEKILERSQPILSAQENEKRSVYMYPAG